VTTAAVLAGTEAIVLQLRELTLTEAGEPVCWTAGLLAHRLAERVNDSAASSQQVFRLWVFSLDTPPECKWS
jgi:hypothetical protein